MLLLFFEFGCWLFYILDYYVKQNIVIFDLEFGLKCMLGDISDNVFGLLVVVLGFGRKMVLKLMQKYGLLEKLLIVVVICIVGREYIQDVLIKYVDLFCRNMQVLSLCIDVDVVLEEEWC